jgi:hypothetical protein
MVTITPVAASDLCSEASPLRPVYVVLDRLLTKDLPNVGSKYLHVGRALDQERSVDAVLA